MNGYIMAIVRYNLRANNMCYSVLDEELRNRTEETGNNGRGIVR